MMTNKLAPFLVSVALLGGCDAEDPSTRPSSEERDAEAAIAPDVLALVEANPEGFEAVSTEDMVSFIEDAIDAELAGEDPQPVLDELELLLEGGGASVIDEVDSRASQDPLPDDFALDQQPQAYYGPGCLAAHTNAGYAKNSANSAWYWAQKTRAPCTTEGWKGINPATDAYAKVGQLQTNPSKYAVAASALLLSIGASSNVASSCSYNHLDPLVDLYFELAQIAANNAVSRSWQSFNGLGNCL